MVVKSMFRLMWLHFKYLHTRNNVILELIAFTILILSFLISSNIFVNYEIRWVNQKEILISYQTLVINLSKIFIPLVSCYLFGSGFLKINDDYKLIIIKKRSERIKYFISKQIVIASIVLMFCLLCNSFYLIFGVAAIPNFSKEGIINNTWLNLYLISVFYGLLSTFVVLITKSSFGYIMVVIIYFVIQILVEAVSLKINILPYLINNHLSINIILLISEIIVLIWSNILYYYYMDM